MINMAQLLQLTQQNRHPHFSQHSSSSSNNSKDMRNILFGKYEIGRLLGQGTFSKVYHGKQLSSGESVAIKVINKDQVIKESLTDQIKREISVMHRVRHPHVVELKEVMATKAKIFFIMEYVRGGELFAKVARGKIREDLARKYFQQLISAVDFCHSRGVFHRDLKPENLLLDDNEDLKVSDFGFSALRDQISKDGLLHTQCGTPAYVAPEVLRKKGYDGSKADIWSCGVILYALLAGFLPFQHDNVFKMYQKILKAEFEFPPWFCNESKQLLSRILVVDPEKRITIQEIMEVPWFRKGFSRPLAFSIVEDPPLLEKAEEEERKEAPRVGEEKKPSPPFFNAFELISSMSSGFDLSNLFESKKKVGSTFASKCPASMIMEKLELIAKRQSFRVLKAKEFKMKMQASVDGRKGKLSVAAEIFEVVPEVSIVELSKTAGDTLEYVKFCEEDVRPALKDIIWSWQGDSNGCENCESNSNNKAH